MDLAQLKRHEDTPPAPGGLEVVQAFLNLHDHVQGVLDDLPPPPEMVRAYLVERGLLDRDAPYSSEDHAAAMRLYHALHGRLCARDSAEAAAHEHAVEDLARRACFRLRFRGGAALEPASDGVDAALGRLLSVVFLAELDASWEHMKECASRACTAVFYDRSKNRSGKWCSMRSCGNKHKVRAWRQRHSSDVVDA